MEMFNPAGVKPPTDYPSKHPVDGYGKQMAQGYGQEPELEPYRTQKRILENKRGQLGQTERK